MKQSLCCIENKKIENSKYFYFLMLVRYFYLYYLGKNIKTTKFNKIHGMFIKNAIHENHCY